jgi:hypothetical protein
LHAVEHRPCTGVGFARKSQSPAQQSLSRRQALSSPAHVPPAAVQVWDCVEHAPEQQSSSAPHGARRAAHAVAFTTQMPSWHVASATQGAPVLHVPSISTWPLAGG